MARGGEGDRERQMERGTERGIERERERERETDKEGTTEWRRGQGRCPERDTHTHTHTHTLWLVCRTGPTRRHRGSYPNPSKPFRENP